MPESIDEREGRALFGAVPNNYNAIRPPYPEQIYDFLRTAGALRPHVSTLEIGAGNGLATRRLLELGADPLTALEPDERFLPLLGSMVIPPAVTFQLIQASFEEAQLPPQCYDLVAAASSFHWLQPSVRLAKAAEILNLGGYLALWWNVTGVKSSKAMIQATIGHIALVFETHALSVGTPKAKAVSSGSISVSGSVSRRFDRPLLVPML